jgi:hypothetical protein
VVPSWTVGHSTKFNDEMTNDKTTRDDWRLTNINVEVFVQFITLVLLKRMSRSALWRQEGNVKERERQAEELFQLAVEEGRVRWYFEPLM